MKTKAVRIHGKMDLRLEEIELPQVGPDDVQVKVISDSICMSTYKAAVEGEDHKRVPNDVAEHPTIVGHEFCGVITEVGENWKNKYKPGQGFAIQPAHFYKGSQLAPGYSYQYCGGDSQYSNIPIETLLTDNLLPYNSDTYFYGSLAEPMSCIIGTFHAMYHTKPGSYEHQMGIVEGGKMAMLASVGPMGLGAIDYALHCDRRPSLLVITDIDDARLERAQSIYTVEHAKEMGVELHYVNTAKPGCDTNYLRELSGGTGYDDVICFAPVRPVVEQAGDILGFDGCLNFFAGPTNSQFKAEFNWYNVHYLYTHVVGTSGGNTSDMKEAIEMMTSGKINPAAMITHIGRPERCRRHRSEPAEDPRRQEAHLHADRAAPDGHRRLRQAGRDRSAVCQARRDHQAPQRPVEPGSREVSAGQQIIFIEIKIGVKHLWQKAY